jgi:WhiB family redox-sensing transcriptional regulator
MAKLICRGCPVSATCLSWALASGQEAGIWGGLTEDQRRRLHRRSRGYRPAAKQAVPPRPVRAGTAPARDFGFL